MIIKVTEDDIKKGRPRSACLCPIALAIQRETNTINSVYVGAHYVSTDYKSYILPFEAQEAIRKFDDIGEMEPFEFELKYDF